MNCKTTKSRAMSTLNAYVLCFPSRPRSRGVREQYRSCRIVRFYTSAAGLLAFLSISRPSILNLAELELGVNSMYTRKMQKHWIEPQNLPIRRDASYSGISNVPHNNLIVSAIKRSKTFLILNNGGQ